MNFNTSSLIFQILFIASFTIMALVLVLVFYTINLILPENNRNKGLVNLKSSVINYLTTNNIRISILVLCITVFIALIFYSLFIKNEVDYKIGQNIFPETIGLVFDALLLVFFYNLLITRFERKKDIEKYEELLDEMRAKPENSVDSKIIFDQDKKDRIESIIKKFNKLKHSEIRLSNIDLSGCHLPNINLTGSKLFRTNFDDANIINATFKDVSCSNSFFENAKLSGAKFMGETKIQHTNFKGSFLRGAEFMCDSLFDCDFEDAKMENVKIENVSISKCNFNKAIVTKGFLAKMRENYKSGDKIFEMYHEMERKNFGSENFESFLIRKTINTPNLGD